MKFIVKDMDIATGSTPVVILNQKDAQLFDLRPLDRVILRHRNKTTVAVLDVAESIRAVPFGKAGLFEETLDALHARHNDSVTLEIAKKPHSLVIIKKKLDGGTLSYGEYYTIIDDIVNDRLTTVELSAFVLANYSNKMSMQEIANLTRAMRDTGDTLPVNKKGRIIADFHSIGGVPGNRTTIIIVPILVAAGLIVPKTSSRAITSPAGTADTMEVLCNVSLPVPKLMNILDTVGGFIMWGGAVNLSPADDKIIGIERPLSIDAEGQMLASIMSKKASVGATHLLIELPIGKGSKVKDARHAKHLQMHFEKLGSLLGIKTTVLTLDGSQPVGNGIGPILEMQDCLHVLLNTSSAPKDLREKSLLMAGHMLEFTRKAQKGKGYAYAQEILDSGKALETFKRIVHAQEGKYVAPDKLVPGKYQFTYRAPKSGRVAHLDNLAIARIARMAGSPRDKGAGIAVYVRRHNAVTKGQPIFTIYAENPSNLKFAKELWTTLDGVKIS